MGAFVFKRAVRKSVPVIMSLSGVTGSGKTMGALLVGAGLAGPNGRVGFLDSENGRGQLYADSPSVLAALPQGFEYAELTPPFSPARYIEAIDAAEKAGVNVLVIDSVSHEWEGNGGCTEMAEDDKGRWVRAKRENRRFVYRLLYSTMHIIVCLRAREKSKIIPKNESPTHREEVVSLGILPICEKGFVFEMLVSLQVEEKTHLVTPIKVPEPLVSVFSGGRMLTKEDGERLREWNASGAAYDTTERLQKQAAAAAQQGIAEYAAFFTALAPYAKKILTATTHAENKRVAEEVDGKTTIVGDLTPEEHAELNRIAALDSQ